MVEEVFSAAFAGVPTKAHETVTNRRTVSSFFMCVPLKTVIIYRYQNTHQPVQHFIARSFERPCNRFADAFNLFGKYITRK